MKIYFEVDKEYYMNHAYEIEEVIPLYLFLKCHVNTNPNDSTHFFKNGLLVAWPSFMKIKNSLKYGQNKITRLLKKLVNLEWIIPVVGKKEYRNYYQLGTYENGKFIYFASKTYTQDAYEIVPITEQDHTQIGPYPNRTIPILNQTHTQIGVNSYPPEQNSYPNLYLKDTISITKKETEKDTGKIQPIKPKPRPKKIEPEKTLKNISTKDKTKEEILTEVKRNVEEFSRILEPNYAPPCPEGTLIDYSQSKEK